MVDCKIDIDEMVDCEDEKSNSLFFYFPQNRTIRKFLEKYGSSDFKFEIDPTSEIEEEDQQEEENQKYGSSDLNQQVDLSSSKRLSKIIFAIENIGLKNEMMRNDEKMIRDGIEMMIEEI